MAQKDRKERIGQGLECLFKDCGVPTTSSEAKLRDIQMAYGILLKRSGLMNLTTIDSKIKHTKRELKVTIKYSSSLCMFDQFNLTTPFYTLSLPVNFCATISFTHYKKRL